MEVDTQNSDNESSSQKSAKLGKCEVCAKEDAKYCCPKCEVKTCCINCLKIHKKELSCDGIRDRSKYIPLKNMTKMDFLSDYTFLEECTRFVNDRKHDKIKHFTRYNKKLSTKEFKLRGAARQNEIALRFLLENFTRNKVNTTYLEWKTSTIFWRVEWIFPNAGNLKFVDERCNELDKVGDLLDKYFNVSSAADSVPMKKQLEFYQSRGIGNIRILLKAEGIKRCNNRYYELDCKKTLRENLKGKTIVEFPVIYLIFPGMQEEFDVIDSDEDVEGETERYQQSLDTLYGKGQQEAFNKSAEEIQNNMGSLGIRLKSEERKKRRVEHGKQPKNLLFMDENLSSDTDTGDVTEEEMDVKPDILMSPLKRIKVEKE